MDVLATLTIAINAPKDYRKKYTHKHSMMRNTDINQLFNYVIQMNFLNLELKKKII